MQELVVAWQCPFTWRRFGVAAVVACMSLFAGVFLIVDASYVLGISLVFLAGYIAGPTAQMYRDRGTRVELVFGEEDLRVRDTRGADANIPWSSVESVRAYRIFFPRFGPRFVEIRFTESKTLDPCTNSYLGPLFKRENGKRVACFDAAELGLSHTYLARELARRLRLDPSVFTAEMPRWRKLVWRVAIYSNAAFIGSVLLSVTIISTLTSAEEARSFLFGYFGLYVLAGLMNMLCLFHRQQDHWFCLHFILVNTYNLIAVGVTIHILFGLYMDTPTQYWGWRDLIVVTWHVLWWTACVSAMVALETFSVRKEWKEWAAPGAGPTTSIVASPSGEDA